MAWDEDYFEAKERKSTDETRRVDIAYAEKRERLASLWKLEPGSPTYRAEVKFLCCCRAPGYINAGCCCHGLSITVYKKLRTINDGR